MNKVLDAMGARFGLCRPLRYDELAPMLLNEVQEQQKAVTAQAEQIAAQAAEIGVLKQQLAVMQAAVVELQAKDELVAQR